MPKIHADILRIVQSINQSPKGSLPHLDKVKI